MTQYDVVLKASTYAESPEEAADLMVELVANGEVFATVYDGDECVAEYEILFGRLPCEACHHRGFVTGTPDDDGLVFIERCDVCGKLSSDAEAAIAWSGRYNKPVYTRDGRYYGYKE